jgi:hypothetical protein
MNAKASYKNKLKLNTKTGSGILYDSDKILYKESRMQATLKLTSLQIIVESFFFFWGVGGAQNKATCFINVVRFLPMV